MSLSTVLKQRREQMGYTLLEIANKMHVTESTVQRWESGNIKSLRRGRLVELAEILNVTPSYLMGWETDQKEKSVPEAIGTLSAFEEKFIEIYRSVPDEKKPEFEAVLSSLLKLSAGQATNKIDESSK